MPRVSIQQTNFTAGEISPRLVGRTDIDRYGNAARSLINAYPVIHGGARRRGGTRFVAGSRFSAGAIVSEAAVPWDAANQTGTWTLTASNTTAEVASGSSIRSVLGTTSRASGKFYFEVVFVSGGTFGSGVRHDIGVTTAHPVSSGASGVGSGAGYRRSGDIFVGGASVATVTALSAGDVVGVAIDLDTGKIWFRRNGTWTSGDPATGASPAATISTGTYWPFASSESGAAMKVTLRSTAASFTGSIPSGFSSWGTTTIPVPTGSDTAVRLVPFIYSRDAAYMLEFGHLYLRVWPAGGGAMLAEVVTPYTGAMLTELDYAQGADTMFISHPSVPIQRLRRFSASSFDLSAAPFLTTPFDELGHAPATAVTLSDATVGTGRTATAAAAAFLPSDVGRGLVSGAGLALIVGYTSATVVTVDIRLAFSGTALASGAWFMDVSPQAIVKPSAKDPVASSIDLTGALSRAADITLAKKTGTGIAVTATASVFVAGDVGKQLYADSGVATITAQTGTGATVDITSDFASATYARGGYGITDSAWRSDDVGKFVRINGGLCKITSYTSASVVKATVLQALTGTVAAPPLAWSLESSVWSAANGYPRTLTLHEQRLVAAGSAKFPQTIWGSRTGDYLDFTKGTADDDAYIFTIAADEVNPISFLAALRNLVVHTYGGEFSLQGGVEKPITPTNVRIRPESAHGSRGVRPVTVGKESVFVQRSGRKVRSMGYRYDFDGYAAPDLTVLAEHVTEGGGVTSMAYQQEPDLVLWAVRGDGAMLSCTLDRDQSVIGWARHYTDGAFESVATIPNGDREETWAIVRRTVDGAEVRYLELIDEAFEPILPGAPFTGYPPGPEVTVYGFTVDCGTAFDDALGATVFAVPHLKGKTVDIVADGAVHPQKVVDASGNVTLDRPSYRTLIGLPFRSEIGLLTPELSTGMGTAQGNSMRVSEVTLRFLRTIGAKVYDGEGVEQKLLFRRFGAEALDVPPEPFTGLTRIETLGWDRGKAELTVVQDQPLPMHLLSVARKLQVND